MRNSLGFEIIKMKKTNLNKGLGLGAFSPSDVSKLLNLPLAKVSRSIKEYFDNGLGEEEDTYSWQVGNSKVVNFYVLVEIYMFFRLRNKGFSAQSLSQARKTMKKVLGSYPFANRAFYVIQGDKLNKLWFENFGDIITADPKLQYSIGEIVEEFSEKLEFDEKSRVTRFFPAGKDKHIVVDPTHQFGAPVIKGTNIKIDVIYSMYKSGDDIDTLSETYDVSKEYIEEIIEYYKSDKAA